MLVQAVAAAHRPDRAALGQRLARTAPLTPTLTLTLTLTRTLTLTLTLALTLTLTLTLIP